MRKSQRVPAMRIGHSPSDKPYPDFPNPHDLPGPVMPALATPVRTTSQTPPILPPHDKPNPTCPVLLPSHVPNAHPKHQRPSGNRSDHEPDEPR
jgi:hypothetical protein